MNKVPVTLGQILFRLFTIEINSANANNLRLIGMMKIQCVTVYPNNYERVFDYNEDSSRTFLNIYGHFANEAYDIADDLIR